MCGILCEVLFTKHTLTNDKQILQRIKNRGPDGTNSIQVKVKDNINLTFFGSVLWMQGEKPYQQPVENDVGVLLYNGDIYHRHWDHQLSDTEFIMNKLNTCKSLEQIILEIKTLKGPFSLIYYDKQSKNLIFTRDHIGRNSLLFHRSNDSYVISNVLGRKYPCIEIPATHIYNIDLSFNKINLYSWAHCEYIDSSCSVPQWLDSILEQQSLPDDEFVFAFDDNVDMSDEDAVIDYIETISETNNTNNDKLEIFTNLLKNESILKTVTKITELLKTSVKIRLETQPNRCKDCIKTETSCTHCTVGILFSGGLDCTILAFFANMFVPKDQPIDLINVAFDTKGNGSYDVPDRITGRQSFQELKRTCKARHWVFREINIPKETLEHYQLSTICHLVYPRCTILDESLGSALWFAAQCGDGLDVSPCRVLLLGSGADELFGGYVRHRNAFKRLGWLGLAKELALDWKRISFRNLARDNRVICDHGRQPRMPYLDEDLVDYVLNLKPWLKCFPSAKLEPGVGDKMMLRLVAFNLTLTQVVTLPKRALQFGTRIANSKQRGSDTSKTFAVT